jgi:hypothetical protein
MHCQFDKKVVIVFVRFRAPLHVHHFFLEWKLHPGTFRSFRAVKTFSIFGQQRQIRIVKHQTERELKQWPR